MNVFSALMQDNTLLSHFLPSKYFGKYSSAVEIPPVLEGQLAVLQPNFGLQKSTFEAVQIVWRLYG